MPRRRPSSLRAEARQRPTIASPHLLRPIGGAHLSGGARAAVLRFEVRSGLLRGSVLTALDTWRRADSVVSESVTSCGVWECCGCHRPVAETRDALESMLHQVAGRAARELRLLVRAADRHIAGDADGRWWLDPLHRRD